MPDPELAPGRPTGAVSSGLASLRRRNVSLVALSGHSGLASAGRDNLSAGTCERVREYFECEYRSKLAAQARGAIDTDFVVRDAAAIAPDNAPSLPP